jgi:hypothetical protein
MFSQKGEKHKPLLDQKMAYKEVFILNEIG